jgi:hypothetical protein
MKPLQDAPPERQCSHTGREITYTFGVRPTWPRLAQSARLSQRRPTDKRIKRSLLFRVNDITGNDVSNRVQPIASSFGKSVII